MKNRTTKLNINKLLTVLSNKNVVRKDSIYYAFHMPI